MKKIFSFVGFLAMALVTPVKAEYDSSSPVYGTSINPAQIIEVDEAYAEQMEVARANQEVWTLESSSVVIPMGTLECSTPLMTITISKLSGLEL